VCREHIERQGWKLTKAYMDRAISGSDILNRSCIQDLLFDAKAKQFDIVVSEALDRLSRDQEDIAAIFKRLRYWEIEIFTLSEGDISELHVGLKGTMNALFLKDLASKIRRGQRGRIEAGLSPCGLSYGYDVVREFDKKGNPVRGKRRINQVQARIIRGIFRDYVNGKSPRKIAAELNSRQIPAPRGGQWNASTNDGHRTRRNGILQNDLYAGQQIYNRVRMLKVPETGKRISRINPRDEWVVVDVPELRIVSDNLWNKVQSKKSEYRNHPFHKSRRAKHLLSGLLSCGECDGGFTVVATGRYGCCTRREKGTCNNNRRISVEEVERRVLDGIQDRLLNPIYLTEFVDEFQREFRKLCRQSSDDVSAIQSRYANIDKKICRIIDAIANSTDTPSLREALFELESEKANLKSQLDSLELQSQNLPELDLEAVFRRKVESLPVVLNKNEDIRTGAGEILRSFIDKIVLLPDKETGKMRISVSSRPDSILAATKPSTETKEERMIKVVAEERLELPTRGL